MTAGSNCLSGKLTAYYAHEIMHEFSKLWEDFGRGERTGVAMLDTGIMPPLESQLFELFEISCGYHHTVHTAQQ